VNRTEYTHAVFNVWPLKRGEQQNGDVMSNFL